MMMMILLAVGTLVAGGVLAAGAGGPLPPSVDLRPRFERWRLRVKSQGARGTCSVFAVTAALEYAMARRDGRGVALSEEFLNWAAHRATGRKVDGGFFHEIWRGYETYGVCMAAALPYAEAYDSDLQPSDAVLRDAEALRAPHAAIHWIKPWDVTTGLTDVQVRDIKEALRRAWPVCCGLRWPRQVAWYDGVLGMATADAVFDGHSILLTGYADDAAQPGGGVFLFKDSGAGGGWRAMPYAYAREFANDACWVEMPRTRATGSK